jgi:pimeloyl-ACP methyl ester carboxylesterase
MIIHSISRYCAWVGAVTLGITLTACGSGSSSTQPPIQQTTPNLNQPASCVGAPVADHRARSLANNTVPRPGPSVLYASAPRAPQLENTGVWQAPPILISGTSAYRCGEFLYQDWLFDDHGALGVNDPGDPQEPSAYLFSPKSGTLTYPTDPVFANNAADFVEFRIKPLANATAFRVTLNTVLDVQRSAFTIALGDSAALRDWPHSANVASPAAWFVTVHGSQVEMVDAATGETITPAPSVSVDLERRQFEVRVPHAAWNPAQETVRVAAGAGLWDSKADSYLQPSAQATETSPGGDSVVGAALFNMAFRDEPLPKFTAMSGRTIADAALAAKEQGRWWRERAQAEALVAGDASPFFAEVDFAMLVAGTNDESDVPQSGFMNRIFASRFVFGQGVDYLSECGGVSASRPCDGAMVSQLQPYTLYVPDKSEPSEGFGLTMLLHALSGNYNQYMGSQHARQLGDRGTGTIVATPAGRGPDGFYFDVAEADVFEVWQDVARHYPLDPEWAVLTGYSMGGIGTFRLAPRYPDLFTRIMPIVAGASSYEDLLPSLRHVPVMMWFATFDELQTLIDTESVVTELTNLQYRLDAYRFETWDHLSPASNDSYLPGAEFLGESRVDRNPAHITFVLDPAEDEPRFDVIADKAYWISGLTLRDESLGTGTIDVRSHGFGPTTAQPQAVVQTNDVLTEGNLEPAPFTRRVLEWAPADGAPYRDAITINAENIASVTIHPERARISCNAEINIQSDGPVNVNLFGCN